MILQFGIQSQIENIITLLLTKNITTNALTDIAAIQAHFRQFITDFQRRSITGENGKVNLITHQNQALVMRSFFTGEHSQLDDKDQSNIIDETKNSDVSRKKNLTEKALEQLGVYSQEYRTLFDTIITDIFFLPSGTARAGSTSNAIGLIWANPKNHYVIDDMVEILVHEMTHHAMFIDELRYGHYFYENIFAEETWAQSAILNIPRPLDKALHSAVVSLEIIMFRKKYTGHQHAIKIHPPTQTMLQQLQTTVESIESVLATNRNAKHLFQKRAFDILAYVKQETNHLSKELRQTP